MKVELQDISVKCSICGVDATGLELNEDTFRFHTPDGDVVRLPSSGLTLEQAHQLGSMNLVCECCEQDK